MDCSLPGFSVHGFSRQEYWSGLPFPSPGDLPDPGIEPGSPVFQADALTSEPPESPSLGAWEIQRPRLPSDSPPSRAAPVTRPECPQLLSVSIHWAVGLSHPQSLQADLHSKATRPRGAGPCGVPERAGSQEVHAWPLREGTFVSNPSLWEDEVLAFHRPSELGLPGAGVRVGPP